MNQQLAKDVGEAIGAQETRLIRKVALYAFLVNLGLAVMKGILAWMSRSLAVTAGAVDSATDALTSLVLYGGVLLSGRRYPAFPLGLDKIENLISVFVVFSIFLTGCEMARTALAGAVPPAAISATLVVLLVAGTVVTHAFGTCVGIIGRRTESPTRLAEGRHRFVAVLSSLVSWLRCS
jgi:divalent metal cation (Fe/Co/Zn/Cd) transporter